MSYDAERLMSVMEVVMEQRGVVPVVAGRVRRDDDVDEAGDVSLVLCVEDGEEDERIDDVWIIYGVMRLYVKESAKRVDTDVRRGWVRDLEEWLRDKVSVIEELNAVADDVKFWDLEASGMTKWENDGKRDLVAEVPWRAVVNL